MKIGNLLTSSLTATGEIVNLGAKVKDGIASRTVKVKVTTVAPPTQPSSVPYVPLTDMYTITIVKPTGELKSRHAGLSPTGVNVPNVPLPPPPTPLAGCIGAWTVLVVIPMPSSVNFGGKFEEGAYTTEWDVKSPPVAGTFTPATGSLLEDATHMPMDVYVKIDEGIAGIKDYVGNRQSSQIITQYHSCQWECEFRWRDGPGAIAYNSNKTGIIPFLIKKWL